MLEKDGELAFLLQKEESDLGELDLEAANLAASAGSQHATGFSHGKRDKPSA